MDLRNYGVIDFAEHVVLPTGDADDLHDLEGLDELTLVGYNINPLTRGKKAQQIAELKEKYDHTDRLLKARTAELAESNKIIVNIEAKLKKANSELTDLKDTLQSTNNHLAEKIEQLTVVAKDNDEKQTEIQNLKSMVSHQSHIIEEVEILVKPSDLSDLDDPEAEWYYPPTPAGKKAPFAARAKTGIKHSRRTHDERTRRSLVGAK